MSDIADELRNVVKDAYDNLSSVPSSKDIIDIMRPHISNVVSFLESAEEEEKTHALLFLLSGALCSQNVTGKEETVDSLNRLFDTTCSEEFRRAVEEEISKCH